MSRDSRSREAQEYRRLYKTKRWRFLREIQLAEHPLCQCPHCQSGEIRVTAAEIVDHIKPHRGDPELFFDPANLQSMGKQCHDRFKQSEERGGAGFLKGVGRGGRPISPEHPWNKAAL